MVTVGIVKVDVALNLTLMTRDLGVVTLAWRAMHARAGGLAEVADKRVKACDLLVGKRRFRQQYDVASTGADLVDVGRI
ncbi:hypothetical protein U1763_20740 [Sphingomonas sp. LB2R24]|uniref:hypothetical protein n=1 Tax=Sphingomonas sorbitolis TaxID=3096165 RepID=UPI002FC8610E